MVASVNLAQKFKSFRQIAEIPFFSTVKSKNFVCKLLVFCSPPTILLAGWHSYLESESRGSFRKLFRLTVLLFLLQTTTYTVRVANRKEGENSFLPKRFLLQAYYLEKRSPGAKNKKLLWYWHHSRSYFGCKIHMFYYSYVNPYAVCTMQSTLVWFKKTIGFKSGTW